MPGQRLREAPNKARLKFWGIMKNVQAIQKGPDLVNNEALSAINAAGTAEVDLIKLNASDQVVVGANVAPQHLEVSLSMPANGDLVDQSFFIASRAYQVTDVRLVLVTPGSDGGAVNLQLEKVTGTTAPGAGTNLLTNNSNAGFDLKGTANTVQVGTLTATTANLQLAAGDRLAVDFAGTLTAADGVVVTVSLKRI